MEDIRQGLPSASIVERVALCPGSLKASEGLSLPSTEEEQEWAESGDRIHLWLRAPEFVDLDSQEMDVAEKCRDQREALITKLFGKAKVTRVEEERVWLKHPTTGRLRFSGQMDFRCHGKYSSKLRFLVLDYKTNRGDITESAANLQLRSLVVMIAQQPELKAAEEAFAAIIQPLVRWNEPEVVTYSREDIRLATDQLHQILDEAQKPNAPLVPGAKQCRFCTARLRCPAARKITNVLNMEELIGINGQELSALLDRCAVAQRVIDSARDQAKAMLKLDTNCIPNWGLKEGGGVRKVTEPFALFEALYSADLMDKDTFIKNCVTVGIGNLEKAIKEKSGLKGKQLADTVAEHCGPFITTTPKSPSLERL